MSEERERIAVLIPVLNEAGRIGVLLQSLSAMDFAEIIVADGGSVDGTSGIVATFPGVRLVACERGRGTQIGAAAAVANCPILVIVHADSSLPALAPQLIRQTLDQPGIAAGCFRLVFEPSTPALSLYAWFTRFETRFTTFGDQCYFMRSQTFHAAGGTPSWPLLEDVELRRRLRAHGRFMKRPEPVVTSARRFTRHGVFSQQVRNALVLAGFACGVPVERLARLYNSGAVQQHPPPLAVAVAANGSDVPQPVKMP